MPAPLRLVHGPLRRTVVLIPKHPEETEIEPPSNWERWTRVGIAIAMLLAAVAAGFAFGPMLVQSTARISHADAATGASPAAMISPSSEPVLLATGLLDTLDVAVRAFAERRVDFHARRIDCAELTAGYAVADSALLRAAVTIRQDRDSLTPAVVNRYARLLAGMDSVNATFDASGCGRP